MSTLRELYEKASQLPESERAELAGLLIESLDTEIDDDAEVAWAAEIEKRLADFDAGNVKTIPWEEVRARLHRGE
jgi:putative addiction module component (TIGR02574 family)